MLPVPDRAPLCIPEPGPAAVGSPRTSRVSGPEAGARAAIVPAAPWRSAASAASLTLAMAAAALVAAYHDAPLALALNAFWLLVACAIGAAAAVAAWRPARLVLGAEVVLALVVVQGLWFVAVPGVSYSRQRLDQPGPQQGLSWRLSFSGLDQALMKEMPRLPQWASEAVYLRVDLSRPYDGPAGFRVEVNGADLGVLADATHERNIETIGIPSWAMRVPRDVLSRAPLVRVVLRPTAIDPRLSIPGHGDPLVEPLKAANSWFFDGATWRNDRLAGPGVEARGTYRIRLWTALGEPP